MGLIYRLYVRGKVMPFRFFTPEAASDERSRRGINVGNCKVKKVPYRLTAWIQTSSGRRVEWRRA